MLEIDWQDETTDDMTIEAFQYRFYFMWSLSDLSDIEFSLYIFDWIGKVILIKDKQWFTMSMTTKKAKV